VHRESAVNLPLFGSIDEQAQCKTRVSTLRVLARNGAEIRIDHTVNKGANTVVIVHASLVSYLVVELSRD
jgi:hypothetical protein